MRRYVWNHISKVAPTHSRYDYVDFSPPKKQHGRHHINGSAPRSASLGVGRSHTLPRDSSLAPMLPRDISVISSLAPLADSESIELQSPCQ